MGWAGRRDPYAPPVTNIQFGRATIAATRPLACLPRFPRRGLRVTPDGGKTTAVAVAPVETTAPRLRGARGASRKGVRRPKEDCLAATRRGARGRCLFHEPIAHRAAASHVGRNAGGRRVALLPGDGTPQRRRHRHGPAHVSGTDV